MFQLLKSVFQLSVIKQQVICEIGGSENDFVEDSVLPGYGTMTVDK